MISAHFARVIHRELSARGLTDRELFDGTGLDPRTIWLTSKLDPEAFLVLLRNARRFAGGTPLGFMVASNNRLAGLGMMGIAMMSAPTLRDGLQAMASFSTLEAGYVRLRVIAGQPTTTVQVILDRDVGDCTDIHAESVTSLVQEYLLDMRGRLDDQLEFRFSYPELGRAALYREHLGGKVTFNAPINGLTFPSAWLGTLSPYANNELWVMARRHLSDQLQVAASWQETPFTSHLRSVLSAHQPPLPDIGMIAESLHLSTRTLNRRLQDEGATYRQLKLEAVHNWSRRMLREGSSVEAIALELGYDNPANFRRSFREYVGESPSEWLARQE